MSHADLLGPRPDAYHNREIPEHQWTTCDGCPALRVFDFHYFYCRHLVDQSHPDTWNKGWMRIKVTHNEASPAPCGLDTPTAMLKALDQDSGHGG